MASIIVHGDAGNDTSPCSDTMGMESSTMETLERPHTRAN